jgi:hypothetical protein
MTKKFRVKKQKYLQFGLRPLKCPRNEVFLEGKIH